MDKASYFLLLLAMICVTCSTARAQESVGFSEPGDIQPLLDYRLPDWGYSNFWLDADYKGEIENKKNSERSLDASNSNDISLAPRFELYREAEAQIINLSGGVNIDYSKSNEMTENDSQGTKPSSSFFSTDFFTSGSVKKYQTENFFLLAGGSFRLAYDREATGDRENNVTDAKHFSRRIRANPKIGIGFGRIRNVTPVIRAIRLDERLRAIGTSGLNGEEVLNAAEQVTRFNEGYENRYDRPEKYFWQDMNNVTNSAFSGITPYDMIYLTDVFDEKIGRRLEGWEIVTRAEFDYLNRLSRYEMDNSYDGPTRTLHIRKTILLTILGRWFKNISLNHQIGFAGDARQFYPLGTENYNYEWNANLSAEFEWLWSVADRWLLETRISNRYNHVKRSPESGSSDRNDVTQWSNNVRLDLELTYFIENKMAVTLSGAGNLTHNGNHMSRNIPGLRNRVFSNSINIGMRYYFSRNLY